MKSKASFFSISRPLVIENLRRFWAIPALSFLVYFLSGVFPLLMTYSHLNNMSSYIELSLNNQQPFYMFAHLLFPVIAAVVIFRYLHSISSVSVMHAMPFTRAILYRSGYLSGLILIIVPILVNGLILLAISKPVYYEYATSEGMMINTANVFSRADILNWIWISVLIVIVIYAVSVFAGIVTGNSLMHFAAAIFFNFIIPGLYAIFIAYFSHYLYGFDTTGNWIELCVRISPFLNAIKNGGDFSIWVTVYYIIIFLILYGISGFLYQKRKLERATDSLAFGFMEPVICYLIAFMGMTLLGFYFEVLGKSDLYMYGGLAAGTIIFFIIGQMIVKKTPRIYNRKSLQNFSIYVLIAALFIVSLNLDITGFENRVPDTHKVSDFTLSEDFSKSFNINNVYATGISFNNNNDKPFIMKDPKNIEAVIALQRSIINNHDNFKDSSHYLSSFVRLAYDPKSAFSMSRRYHINYDFFKNSKEFKQIYESDEFKEYYSLKNLKYEKLSSINIGTETPLSEAVEISSPTELQELMNCMDQDFCDQSFEDMVSLKHSYAIVNINFAYKNSNSKTPEQLLANSISYRITASYKKTIQWLEDHHYADSLNLNIGDIEYIEIAHYVQSDTDNEMTAASSESKVFPELSQMKTLKITDPKKIEMLMDSYETQNSNYQDYYYGIIYIKGNEQYQQSMIKDGFSNEVYLKENDMTYSETKVSDIASNATMQIYFNEGNIPNYIFDYFKK